MVPTGRTRILDADTDWPVHMGFKRPFSALTPQLECQSRDQARHRPNNFRAVGPPKSESSGSSSNHIRRTHKRTGQRGPGRTSKFWGISNQAKRWSGCQKPSNGRCRQRATTVFCELQTGQRNGSTGKETRRATGPLESIFYREAFLVADSKADTYLFQQNTYRFEKFYHRTEMSCPVHNTQTKTLGESSRWSIGSYQNIFALYRTKNDCVCEKLTYSTKTEDKPDTGSAAR
jgi:hypothetical protein